METQHKYLYGASIQGIQNFIFQTNKLKDIIYGSDLVEKICMEEFKEFEKNGKSIVKAAGNIKHVFDKEEDCRNAVLNFPKKIMSLAPSITVTQAVVSFSPDSDFEKTILELEDRLKIQKNKPARSMTLGLAAIERSPLSGLLEDDKTNEAHKIKTNSETSNLIQNFFGEDLSDDRIAYDIDKIAGENNWIAVIHADGNGMGSIVQQIGKNENDLKQFSSNVQEITKHAAQTAFKDLNNESMFLNPIPFRPVILGGDDLTLICRADLAIPYTQIFLETFENESKKKFDEIELKIPEHKQLLKKGLTACAGISFIKTTYPFHYAADLAESLCKQAKTKAREIDEALAPSCLMFHKVQDSFTEDYKEIVKRELTPQFGLSFEFGPYYCGAHAKEKECENTISSLLENVSKLKGKEGNSVKSGIRQWLNLLFENTDAANQKMKRLRTVNKTANTFIPDKFEKIEINEKNRKEKPIRVPYYDILSLLSLENDNKNQEKK